MAKCFTPPPSPRALKSRGWFSDGCSVGLEWQWPWVTEALVPPKAGRFRLAKMTVFR